MEINEQLKKTQTDYNKKFMDKEKDKKYKCDICEREFSYYAKSKHLKTKYHKFAQNLKDKLQSNNHSEASNTSPESEPEPELLSVSSVSLLLG